MNTPKKDVSMDPTVTSESNKHYRKMTKFILWESNRRLIAVLLWFIILGPLSGLLAVVIYRCVDCFYENSAKSHSVISHLHPALALFKYWLDWFPVRAITLIYFLVGYYRINFAAWSSNLLNYKQSNETFLIQYGLEALGADSQEETADIEENQLAFTLVNRVLFIILLIAALINFGIL